MKEIWKEVKGYEGLYMISNTGRLRRLSRVRSTGGGFATLPDAIVNGWYSQGYKRYSLIKGGIKTEDSAHRLIAIHFIPNPENKPCINHKNGIKSDNRISNLEWCTKAENNQHAYDTGLKKGANPKGVVQLSRSGDIIRIYRSILEASNITGIVRANINRHIRGNRPTAGGFVWKHAQSITGGDSLLIVAPK